MSRLLHLNGPPGIGKSTVARRWAADHPGVLVCDIDVLRTLVGGWRDDFAAAGALIRPAALAMIEAYLAHGQDVVLPQLLLDPAELALFEACAERAGAGFAERVLMDSAPRSVARFHRRGVSDPDPWHDEVRAVVAAEGGDERLLRCHAGLERLLLERPDAIVVPSTDGDVETTYAALLASLDDRGRAPAPLAQHDPATARPRPT